jgi:predicted nucleic acid-binding protein
MIVISDTTPLISLMKIGQLDLVHRMFGEIQIPDAVFRELVSNKRFSEECRQIRESSFIKTVRVADILAADCMTN